MNDEVECATHGKTQSSFLTCSKCVNRFILAGAALKRAQEALEHIADKGSRRDCCKFAVFTKHRRRHLREVAQEARADIERILKG